MKQEEVTDLMIGIAISAELHNPYVLITDTASGHVMELKPHEARVFALKMLEAAECAVTNACVARCFQDAFPQNMEHARTLMDTLEAHRRNMEES